MSGQGYEQLTLFLEDSHASRLVLPGSEEARKMTVTSGRKCLELYGSSGPLGSLVRMCLESSIWHSTRCFLRWKTKVTKSNRLLFQLAVSMPRTKETVSPLWPTATTDSATDRTSRHSQGGMPLALAVKMWPTPKASDSKGTGPIGSASQIHDAKKGNLRGVVLETFATPQARDFRTGQKSRWEDPKRSRNLNDQIGGQLNPAWVEWLMGFPIGWTELNPSETR